MAAGSSARKSTTAAKKKTAAKKSTAQTEVTEPRKTVVTPRWVRNLRNHPVHFRLKGQGQERPYFIQLSPRGLQGDAEDVPRNLLQSRELVDAVNNRIVELITETEYKKVAYPLIGYLRDAEVTLIREEDTVIARSDSQDAAIQANPRARVTRGGPTFVEVPGSMPAPQPLLDGRVPTADDMIPDGVDVTTRKVTVERRRA